MTASIKLFIMSSRTDSRIALLEPRENLFKGAEDRLLKAVRVVAIAASLLTAAGCATNYSNTELAYTNVAGEVPVSKSAILPPPGGPAIIAVLQKTYKNGIAQEIALSTPARTMGQNGFYISLINDAEVNSEADNLIKTPSLMPDALQMEMEERIPETVMETTTVFAQNKYGPFGFATGRSPQGDLCLYAWQQIEPDRPSLFVAGGIVSVRLRLCSATATTEQLLQTMYHYTIVAYIPTAGWDPFGTPPATPERLGKIDAPIYPLGLEGAAKLGSPEPRTVIRYVPVAGADQAPAARKIEPLAGYPAVPLPE